MPVAHVEAGLRSFNKKMPEEINRILVDQLSTLLFTPTSKAREHLLNEGFSTNAICQVGDIMLDAVKFFSSADLLTKIETPSKPYALVTIHRAENTDSKIRLQNIVHGLEEISSEMEVVWPIHPRTESYLSRHGMETNLKTVCPVGYLEMLALMKNAEVIITDSEESRKRLSFRKLHALPVVMKPNGLNCWKADGIGWRTLMIVMQFLSRFEVLCRPMQILSWRVFTEMEMLPPKSSIRC